MVSFIRFDNGTNYPIYTYIYAYPALTYAEYLTNYKIFPLHIVPHTLRGIINDMTTVDAIS